MSALAGVCVRGPAAACLAVGMCAYACASIWHRNVSRCTVYTNMLA